MTKSRDENAPSHPPLAVLLDTNVWVYQTQLLRTPVARAFLHALRQRGGRILLPEVYEMEVVRHAKEHGSKELEKARKSVGFLQTLTGRSLQSLPALDFRAVATERIQELESLIQRLPFTCQHARGALERVMDGRPPSKHKSREFKDSAAWEALLATEGVTEVSLITTDSDFAESPKEAVLSAELADEAAASGLVIRMFPDIPSFMDTFAQDIPVVNEDALASSLDAATDSELRTYAEKRGLELLSGAKFESRAFLTEREGVLGVEFRRTREARPTQDGEIYPDVLFVRAEGECTLDVDREEVSEVRLHRIVPISTERRELRGKTAFSRVSATARQKIPLDKNG